MQIIKQSTDEDIEQLYEDIELGNNQGGF